MFPVEVSGTGRCNAEIKFQGEINLNLIAEYIKVDSNTPWDGGIQTILTALNAFLNCEVRSKFLSMGKRIFPQTQNKDPIYLPGGIELKHGFYQSIRLGWGKNFFSFLFFFFIIVSLLNIRACC